MMLNSILTYSASSHSFSKTLLVAANGDQNRKPQLIKMYEKEIIWSPATTETSTAQFPYLRLTDIVEKGRQEDYDSWRKRNLL